MASRTLSFEYEEEDGYEIERDGVKYLVLGGCEADYTYTFDPGDRWTPPDESFERDDFEYEVGVILDEDGNTVDIQLTKDEKELFAEYLGERLEDVARDSDRWEEDDDDDYDYERDDWPDDDDDYYYGFEED